jgi:small-conductance mechanosensitive channel
MEFLELEYFDNPVRQYLYAAGVAVATVVGVRLVRMGVRRRLRRLAALTQTSLDDLFFELIASTRTLVVLALAICAGLSMLELPSRAARLIPVVAMAVVLIQVGLWGTAAVRFFVEHQRKLRTLAGETDTLAAFGVLGVLGMGVVWVIVFMLMLDNFGVDVTALVTGLGIGGVAVALAVQKILSDLFASVSIVLDKPFQVGDFIIVDSFMGTVEHVGLKTTRVASLGGERIVFSNSDLVNARLRNYKDMKQRRVLFKLGVLYDTSAEQIAAIPGLVREAIEGQENTRFDRAHFLEYGDSALVFEVVYYVTSPDYNVYMDIQHAINLGLMQRFQEHGIGFAFPTRTVYMHTVEQPGRDAEEPGRAGDRGRAARHATGDARAA